MRSSSRFLKFVYWLPIVVAIPQYFPYSLKVVTGSSMRPILNPSPSDYRDIAISRRFTPDGRTTVNRGEIVQLRSPQDPGRLLVKRVIGITGDTVKTLPPYPVSSVRIPPGHVWVEGDETFRSHDSNSFGPVPLALLTSTLSYIVWPPHRFGAALHPSHSDTARVELAA